MTIINNLRSNIIDACLSAPLVGGVGYLCGYAYATYADLSTYRLAEACAVWLVAQNSIFLLCTAFAGSERDKKIIKFSVSILGSIVGIYELSKRGLMDDKLMTFILLFQAVGVPIFIRAMAKSSA